MAKSTHLWFSNEHPDKDGEGTHVDTYRQLSDSSKADKVEHSPISPGYGREAISIPVNTKK